MDNRISWLKLAIIGTMVMAGCSSVAQKPATPLIQAQASASGVPTQEDGMLAPEFTLETSAGVKKSLSEARGGKKAVIFFWATWCPYCHTEMLNMNYYQENLREQGINVILVSLGDSKEDVNNYLQRNKIPWESFLDEETALQDTYSVAGLPTLYYVDESGIIRAISHAFQENYADLFKPQS